MITCTINGQTAQPDTSQKIKITRENMYIKDSGEYTYEISFPMSITENRSIFGAIDRIDTHKDIADLDDVVITAGDRTVISGRGIVMSVTEEVVKVQVVGGKSKLKWDERLTKIYIDQQPWNPSWAFNQGRGDNGYDILDMAQSHGGTVQIDVRRSGDYLVGKAGVCVFTPIRNVAADRTMNRISLRDHLFKAGDRDLTHDHRHHIDNFPDSVVPQVPRMSVDAVQPNFFWVLNYLMKVTLGERPDKVCCRRNDFDCLPWTAMYIANAKPVFNFFLALPHWSLYTLLQETERFFGGTIIIDKEARQWELRAGNVIYEKNAVEYDCEDVFSSSQDKDGLKCNITSNIEYKLTNAAGVSPRRSIPQSVLKYYGVKDSAPTSGRSKAIWKGPFGCFYTGQDATHDTVVGDFTGLYRDIDADNSIELHIVPVGMAKVSVRTSSEQAAEDGAYIEFRDRYAAEQIVSMPVMEGCKVSTHSSGYADITTEIKTGRPDVLPQIDAGDMPDNNEDSDSVMEVFFTSRYAVQYLHDNYSTAYYAGTAMNLSSKVCWPAVYVGASEAAWSGVWYKDENAKTRYTMSLHYAAGGRRFDAADLIDIHNRVQINFFTDDLPDPTRLYLFRGKRYLCEKIEMELTDEGVQRRKTGYFYQLKD